MARLPRGRVRTVRHDLPVEERRLRYYGLYAQGLGNSLRHLVEMAAGFVEIDETDGGGGRSPLVGSSYHPDRAVEEIGDCSGEGVVVVAGNHVTGAAYVRCFGVRDELEEFVDRFLRNYI